jgi:hypothetical protein
MHAAIAVRANPAARQIERGPGGYLMRGVNMDSHYAMGTGSGFDSKFAAL